MIATAILFTMTSAATLRTATLGCSCEMEHIKQLVLLSEATHKIFALDSEFSDSRFAKSSRRLRRQHGVDLHEEARHFMERINQRISHTVQDLEVIMSKNGDEIKRALSFMAEIIESEYKIESNLSRSPRQITVGRQKNVNMIVERATLSLKHIAESFISLAAQCRL